MKKVLLLVILLLSISAGGWYVWQQKTQQENSSYLTLYGNVDIRESLLAFNDSEHIDKMFVEEGDHVTKGQLLATLNTETIQASIAQIQAQIEAQKQIVKKLVVGVRPEVIERAKMELKIAKIRAKSARDTEHRQISLLKRQLISPETVENSTMLADAAKYNIQTSKLSLDLLIKGSRQEDIAAAKSTLQALEARLQLTEIKLKNASLHAPEAGIIRNRIMQPGEMAFPQTPVFSLALSNPVWIRAYLSETALGKVQLGALVDIKTDSYPNKTYQGWVGFISPTAEFTPKNVQTPELRTQLVYSVRIFACNPQDELRLGMPATVKIKLGQPAISAKNHHCA